MPSTRRSARLSSRNKESQMLNSLTRKIKQMSPTKKHKLKRVIHKFNATRKAFKAEQKKRQAELKRRAKLYGKYSKSYRTLEKRLNPFTADKILKLTKQMDDYEKKIIKERKELNKKKEKLKKNLDKETKDLNYTETRIRNISSPGWREDNLSPELVERLTQSRINEEIQELRDDIRFTEKKIRMINEKLDRVEDRLRDLK